MLTEDFSLREGGADLDGEVGAATDGGLLVYVVLKLLNVLDLRVG